MSWLLNNSYQLLPTPWSMVVILVSALLCGIIIGIEREKKLKPAGLRTMILIALGSALFTVLSRIMTDSVGEQTRIAAQIVSGIGFLGAGSILHDTVRVRGMTTAATIWVMAALGMLCGAGYGVAAIGLTLIIILLLHLITLIENRYIGPCFFASVVVVFHDESGKTGIKIDALLEDYHVMPAQIQKTYLENGMTELTLNYCNAHKHHKDFLLQFARMPEVKSIAKLPL